MGRDSLLETQAFRLAAVLLASAAGLYGQRTLVADGQTDPYTQMRSVLGATPETPDCAHASFGSHITQTTDAELGRPVFVFHMHVTPDNDRCSAFDRQRLEIKTDGGSPAYLKGFLNDTVTFRWRFRLPAGFQASSNFTHIHQIKAGDGDADAPILTLTPRRGTPDQLQLIWSDGGGGHGGNLTEVPLAPFLDTWVEAYEQVSYSTAGRYSIVIRRVRDGAILLQYTNEKLDLWRNGTTFVRPKWGIYRSLNSAGQLRDEQVRFARFCLAKGTDDCVAEPSPEIRVQANPEQATVAPGSSVTYQLNLGVAGIPAALNFNVAGLPAGATAAFNPGGMAASGVATLTVSASGATPGGTYQLLIAAANAVSSVTTRVTLVVNRAGATPPSIAGIRSGASFLPGLSGNQWVAVTGTNLSATTRSWRSDEFVAGKLPTELDGVSVAFNGIRAAVAYVSATQLNVLVPAEVVAGTPVTVQVTTPEGASTEIVSLDAVAPGFFLFGADTGRYVAALHGSDNLPVGKPGLYAGARPAAPGEVVTLYGTGFGATYPAVPSGQAVARAQPIANAIRVTFDGVAAEVLWAGVSAAGLDQVNVKVPESLPDGDTRVTAAIAGIATQDNVLLTVHR